MNVEFTIKRKKVLIDNHRYKLFKERNINHIINLTNYKRWKMGISM